ncbi:Protein N-acetyltransferase, RimJ/RimL family [Chitinophaga sp. YR627]|uniref:GNAT family N-acetyltransferase n=1 Tax=Chitinophaga sp. YR627 TaxID=1881041 RepID=UPI0008F3474E|nr:GNAT family N-acetyltransferase [Chitinophaga sp. YR627]SFO48741.1 Protein N-acetyltransferase, RimJ/RimL family [Chitinophaga sp. YR627]
MTPFNFSGNVVLEDERVILRPLVLADDEYLIPFAVQEPEIWQFSTVPPVGPGGMREYIRTAAEARNEGKEYPFIVFDKQLQRYAGSTRFYDIQLRNSALQLGYTWYGKDFQGTGLNKHCKFLLLQYAFERMGMERVEFRAAHTNERSIAAMKSIGCTVEGILRSVAPNVDGTRRSSIILSILKEEWLGALKENLRKRL